MRRLPPVLLAVPALGLARLLPATGLGLGLRLAAATACILLPGALVARAIGVAGFSAAFGWTMGALFLAMTVMFAVHGSFWLTVAIMGAIALAALPFAMRVAAPIPHIERHHDYARLGVIVAGVGFGIALWHVAGLDGDAFFHLGRTRKLLDLGSLSLKSVDEFRDGGLHPGYAFPLWHGFVGLVARLAGADPAAVVLHLPSVLAPLSFLLFYEAGTALFATVSAGVATVLAQVALTGFAPGHGGAFRSLALPPTTARQLFVPAALALFFSHCRDPSVGKLSSLCALSLGFALVHPSYAIFAAIPILAFLAVRLIVASDDLGAAGTGVISILAPTALVVAWLLPVVNKTASHDPGRSELRRAFSYYEGQLVGDVDSYRLAAPLFSRSGAVAVAALLMLPLAALAIRRRWAAYVLGGSVVVFALTLLPFTFPLVADAVSISQGRRLAGLLPYAFALAGGAAVLTGLLRILVLPLALGAGIALQLLYPGVFGDLRGGGPAWPAWFAFAGGTVALVAALVFRRRSDVGRPNWIAATAVALFVIPVAVHGFREWSPSPRDPAKSELTNGLIAAVRVHVPERAVVFSDPQTDYLLGAYAPVYIASAPISHVADTSENRPKQRVRDTQDFFTQGGDLAIPRRYGAHWIVVDRKRRRIRLPLPRVYSDDRYVLYRLR